MVFINSVSRQSAHRVIPAKYIKGSGARQMYGGEGGWFSKIWPTLKTVGKYALPALLPFAANWLFNRNKPADQQVSPSQQLTNLKDRYSQYLPEDLADQLDDLTTSDKAKTLLSMIDKKPPRKPKKKKELDDDEREEVYKDELTGEGIGGRARKPNRKIQKFLNGRGIMYLK